MRLNGTRRRARIKQDESRWDCCKSFQKQTDFFSTEQFHYGFSSNLKKSFDTAMKISLLVKV